VRSATLEYDQIVGQYKRVKLVPMGGRCGTVPRQAVLPCGRAGTSGDVLRTAPRS
jgi:hypothetical protein